jgi:hypothetical protein
MPRKLPNLKSSVNVMQPIESSVLSRIPCIFGACGATGSGKTYICLSVIKLLRREKSLTKLFIISPSYEVQPIFSSVVTPDDFVLSDISDTDKVYAAVHDIERMCNELADTYYEQLEWQLALKRFMAAETLTPKEEHLIELYGYTVKPILRPSPALLIDDMSHTPLLSRCTNKKNPLNNLVLRSRQATRGLGLSIFIIAQNCTGIPRVLRMNYTHMAVFATGSDQEIKNYYTDAGSQVSLSHFQDMFKAYTAPKHGYLFVDLIRRQFSDSV